MEAIQNEARAADPFEVCGLLLGDGMSVCAAAFTENVAACPKTQFEIDPVKLIEFARSARAGGPQIIGYYHSHPTGNILPSKVDAASAAADGRIWLIVNGKEAAAWRASQSGKIYGRFDPVPLDCRPMYRQTASS